MRGLAKRYSRSGSGRPIARYALNVINKWLRENGKPEVEVLSNATLEDAQAAFDAHVKRHQAERARGVVKTKIIAEDIFEMADQQRREAEIRAAGMMTRKMVEERLREFGDLSEAEIAAAMTLMDLRADQFARQQGLLPSEATRDAWYATRIGDVLTEEGAGKVSLEQKLTGMNDIQRKDFLFNMESVSVDTTSLGTERASIVQGAKEAYARISNTTVTNIHDGREIKFRKRGINRILGHIAHNLYDAKVVVSLPEIVRKGILLFSTRSEDVNDRALYYHYGTKTNIDGEEAFVRVIVREQSGNLFYDSHVTLMGEIEKTSSRASSATLTAADSRESLSRDILLNWLVKVKQSGKEVEKSLHCSSAPKANTPCSKTAAPLSAPSTRQTSAPWYMRSAISSAVSWMTQTWI